MIAPGGRILLTDFGVARLETEDSLVTKTGALLGTPAYMSPEQAAGDVATARSDLYSLGATLYQLATGTLPYAGSPAKVLAQIATGSLVAPVKKRPAVGPDLSRLIEKLMAAEPELRIPTAVATAAELRAIAAASGLGEPADELAAYFADPDAFVRDRTPKIVASIVVAAKQALAEAKLPRAMALADRASSLAPDDPAVTTLIEKVAEGGRATRRRKVIAIGAVGLAVAGGGTMIAVKLAGGHATQPPGDAAMTMVVDASLLPPDAPIDGAPPDAADVLPPADAAPPRPPKDAGGGKRDAGATAVAAFDADLGPPIDAAPLAVIDAAPATGTIVVKTDSWCDVTVDGEARGGFKVGKPFSVTVSAGRHTLSCVQTGLDHQWSKPVDVPAGGTVTVEGVLITLVDVSLEIDATIDRVVYKAGTVAKLKGRHYVEAGGVKKYVDFSRTCHLRSKPELDCYP
jgi:hypothetical protein